ncbi:hypothetical protein ACFV7R_44570 [Streptomyces sp. NPDC059866]
MNPQTLNHVWSDFLHQADRVLLARLEDDASGDDGPRVPSGLS